MSTRFDKQRARRKDREGARGARLLVSPSPCHLVLLIFWMVGAATAGWALADDADVTSYRRIFVPADDLSAWPRGDEKLLPIEARDFEAWAAAANRDHDHAVPAARIAEASYSARYDGQQLVDGRGRWQIELPGARRAILHLDSRSPTISEPQWTGDDPAPARLGTWGQGGGPPDVFGLEVLHPGSLEFQWQAPSQETSDGFEVWLRLPPATVTRLTLDLPEDMRPVLEGSVVLESRLLEQGPGSREAGTRRSSDSESPLPAPRSRRTDSQRRWTLAVAQPIDGKLRIVSADAKPPAAPPDARVSEELRYEISERGLNILATLSLDKLDPDAGSLVVPLPAGVQLLGVTWEEGDLTWEITAGDETSASRAIIELPPRAAQPSLRISLRAWQALEIDRRWTMPLLRPEDSFWTAGTIQLSIAPLMELRALLPSECLRTDVLSSLESETGSEIWSFHAYSPAAKVEVTVGPRRPEATVRVGTNLEVGDPDVTARATTELEVARGSLHALSADVRHDWIIESVQTVPADALDAWYIDQGEGARRLAIQLARAVRDGGQLTVVVTGRLQRSGPLETLAARSLGLVQWQEVKTARDLLAVRTMEPYVVESAVGLPDLAPAARAPGDRALVEAPPGGQVYDLARATRDAAIQLAFRRGNYEALIHVDVTCTGDELLQSYRIVCQPQGSHVDSLLVYASQPLAANVEWTTPSSGARLAAERVVAESPLWARLPAGGELWQLRLRPPSAEPVEIVAAVVQPWSAPASVPLVSVPEANRQQARVTVRHDGERQPRVDPQGLEPAPLPSEWHGEDGTDAARPLAAYRYDPSPWQDDLRRPRLLLSPIADELEPSRVVARSVSLTSFYAADGVGSHHVRYLLENDRAAKLELQLPRGAQLTSAEIDGRPVALSTERAASRAISIDLPRRSRSAHVSLSLATRQAPLAAGSRLAAPLPEGPLAMLAGEWNVALPEDFEIAEAAQRAGGQFNWRRRLFGPLGGAAKSVVVEQSGRGATAPLLHDSAPPLLSTSTVPLPRPDGWGNYRLTFVGQEPAGIVVTHVPTIRTWAISLFLVSLVGGYRLRGGLRTLYIVALALAAGLALLLPATYAPLATGALAGLLGSLVVVWPRSPRPREAPTRILQQMTTVSSMAVVLAFGTLCNLAAAESPGAGTVAPNDERLERVFIPVDEDGRLADDKLYVSERLLRKLLHHAAGPEAEGQHWLVRTAVVQGQLTHSMDQPELVCGLWTLTLDIQSLSRDTTIELPLVREEADWSPHVALDGIPTPIRWNADGTRAMVEVSEPGHYELSLSFTPIARLADPRHEVTLTLPKLFRSELHLSYPAETIGLEVRGAEALEQGSPGTVVAAVDESGRVEVSWPRGAVPAGRTRPRVTELRWLTVGPDAVLLEVKYATEGAGWHPESLLVAADEGWQLLTSDDGRPNPELEERDNGRQLLRVPLVDESSHDGKAHREGRLRLRLARPTPWGQVRLPGLELVAGSEAGFDVGLSMDGDLDCRVLGSEKYSAGESGEFLAAWGPPPATEPPQIVLSGLRSNDTLDLAVQPRNPLSRIDEVLHVAATEEGLRVQYQADVEPGETRRYQYSLEVPPELAVEEVLMSRGGRPVPLRWVRLSREQLNVFFSQEVKESYRLVLIGRVTGSGAKRYALPRVTAISDQSAAQLVSLYREESVLVEVAGPVAATSRAAEGPPRQESSATPPLKWNARPVGSYRLDAKTAELVHVAVSPNRAEITGETLITLVREANGWRGIFTGRLNVEGGELDSLRLRVPVAWSGPFAVRSTSHSVSATVTPINDRQASLTLHLAQTAHSGEELALEIHAPLASSPTQPVAVPEIVLEKRGNRRRYVAVPARLDGEVLSWSHAGVNPAELPDGLRPTAAPPQIVRSFRVMTTPSRVALESPQSAELAATVRLADTLVLSNAGGGGVSVTRFVIAPQGLIECVMELPAEEELVSVRLDGHPALVYPDESRPGAWRVQLGPPQLPQNLEVVSRHDRATPGHARRTELRRPTLYGGDMRIGVELSLWSLGRTGFDGRPLVAGAARTTALDQAALRLDRLVSIAEAAASVVTESGAVEGDDWFGPWAETLAAARTHSQRLLAEQEPTSSVVQVTHPVREQLVAASERAAGWIEQAAERWAPQSDVAPPAEPAWPVDGDGRWMHWVAEGGEDRLAIQWIGSGATPNEARLLGLLAILGMAAGSIWLARRPAACDWLWRCPHALGVLAGLAYWAWLQPSWLGLAIAAGSLVLLLGPGWRRHLPWEETSTVLRAGSRS